MATSIKINPNGHFMHTMVSILSTSFNVLACYTPSSKHPNNRWAKDLHTQVDLVKTDIITSDLNHHLHNPPPRWRAITQSHDLSTVAPTQPTFHHHNTNIQLTIINFTYITTSSPFTRVMATTLSLWQNNRELSNHKPVLLTLHLP
jgi:hypothetical protein